MGLYFGQYFIQKDYVELGLPYYQILMFFGPLPAIRAALSAFYVGRGKTILISAIVVIGNIINILLNGILIFGIEGYISALGTAGAAIATVTAEFLQVIVLFGMFLSKKNREEFGTGKYKLNLGVLRDCLRIGVPQAFSLALVLVAWALYHELFAGTGRIYIATFSLVGGYFYLTMFISDGIGKAVVAICSNLIGAQRYDYIPKVMKSAIGLIFIIGVILSVPLIFWNGPSIEIFVSKNPNEYIEGFREMASDALAWAWWGYLINGILWIYMSQLVSAGDTKYTMWVNIIAGWLLLVMPAYVLVVIMGYTPTIAWKLMDVCFGIWGVLLAIRYYGGRWKKIKIV